MENLREWAQQAKEGDQEAAVLRLYRTLIKVAGEEADYLKSDEPFILFYEKVLARVFPSPGLVNLSEDVQKVETKNFVFFFLGILTGQLLAEQHIYLEIGVPKDKIQ